MREPLRRHRRRHKQAHGWIILCAVILALILAFGTIFGTTLAALFGGDAPSSEGSSAATVPTARKTLPQDFINRNTASPYIILADITNDRVMYQKQADVKCYPASMTKLMTALVALENAPADSVITVGDEIRMIAAGSSTAHLSIGTRLTVEQALYALMLPSGNDAAYTIAAHVGRVIAADDTLDNRAAIDAFCRAMNDKAEALGCNNTHFVNPDGIHDNDHYTTAADMLKIAEAALGQEMIARIVSTGEVQLQLVSGQSVTWTNSNKLVRENNAFTYAGATGLKTGSTDEAGYCLAASATRDGQTSIAIVMGATEEYCRWEDASGLLDISFQ